MLGQFLFMMINLCVMMSELFGVVSMRLSTPLVLVSLRLAVLSIGAVFGVVRGMLLVFRGVCCGVLLMLSWRLLVLCWLLVRSCVFGHGVVGGGVPNIYTSALFYL